jgi:hypothetical protein
MRRSTKLMSVAAALMLGACAPVTFAGGPTGATLTGSPSTGVQLSQCSMFGFNSLEAARMGVRSPAIQVGAMKNRVNQIQARMSFGMAATGPQSWRRLASGEC